MLVRRLDENGDLTFGGGRGDYLQNSVAAVVQVVWTRLRLWRGEWFLDTEEGTPWSQAVLGFGTRDLIEPALRARILGTPGVTDIVSFGLVIDEQRQASIRVTIATAFGNADLVGNL